MNRPDRADGTDVKAWEEDRVPKDVLQVMCYVYCRRREGPGPSWKEIALFMNWPNDRLLWRHKLKRMRRWGLRWVINKSGSTYISKAALPYVAAKCAELTPA